MQHPATVGVAEHGNSAVLVTVAPSGDLLDRRRIDLTRGLPTHPYHHEGSWAVGRYVNSPWAREISLAEAVPEIRRSLNLLGGSFSSCPGRCSRHVRHLRQQAHLPPFFGSRSRLRGR
jgi:hypothetical protein